MMKRPTYLNIAQIWRRYDWLWNIEIRLLKRKDKIKWLYFTRIKNLTHKQALKKMGFLSEDETIRISDPYWKIRIPHKEDEKTAESN